MNADDFASKVKDRLPMECPSHNGKMLKTLLFSAAARAIADLPASEVDETEKAVCFGGKEGAERG